jgi:3-oxoadipate enol-lactonase
MALDRAPIDPLTSDTAMTRVGAYLGRGWRDCVDPTWLAGWDPQPFALSGGITEVVVMGSGPAVVLLPPMPGFKEAWIGVAGILARSFRVVTFDMRSRFPAAPDWHTWLDDLERILDAHAPGVAGIVGHSMGGALAQQWAIARPERVRALLLSSSFARLTHPAGNLYARFIEQPLVIAGQRLLPRRPALAVARLLARHGRWVYDPDCDDRLLDFIRFCMRDTSPVTIAPALKLVAQLDTRVQLPSLRIPTLVVVGERESVFQLPSAEELVRLIPGAELRMVPRVSHLHPLSAPQWLAQTITEWMGPRLA